MDHLPPPAVIRRAAAADAPEIARLYAQLVDNAALQVLPGRVAELAGCGRTALLVADTGPRLAGTLLLVLRGDAMFGHAPFAVIENVVVDAAWRGRGVGSQLLNEAQRLCTTAGCSKAMLLSDARRTGAHAFFERRGFAGDRKRGFVKYRAALAAGA